VDQPSPLFATVTAPITEETAPLHVQRAWYVALGTAAVMLVGGLFTASFNLILGGVIVVGLGHGMMQKSWISAGALAVYLIGILTQAGWKQGQPILILLAAVVGYFLVQGVRATLFWRQQQLQAHAPPA
jgi:hypothetical protein